MKCCETTDWICGLSSKTVFRNQNKMVKEKNNTITDDLNEIVLEKVSRKNFFHRQLWLKMKTNVVAEKNKWFWRKNNCCWRWRQWDDNICLWRWKQLYVIKINAVEDKNIISFWWRSKQAFFETSDVKPFKSMIVAFMFVMRLWKISNFTLFQFPNTLLIQSALLTCCSVNDTTLLIY